ncbi:MAG: nucleoside monophosphate kinase, partial [Bacteroidales bacterium]|nr:nucleoside monophosphate kinase [Bacteroidales bacterium]
SGFLFDGFPRTYVQAYILEGLMLKLNTALSSLISIELKEEESVNRLVQRGKISGRSDDNESVIRKRLNEYRTKTIPVIDFYKERGIFQAVDGSQDIKDVKKSISNIMSKELHKELFNVIIFGYPGSGRASYAKAISEKYGLENMDMSKMLKTEIANNTLLGQKIKAHYENEETVSDEIAVQLIEEKLEKSHNANGFIFKGFPRTLVQSYILDGLLKRHQSSISMVFNLDMTAIEAIQMHDNKHITDGSMNKDKSTANTIRRFKEHEKKTLHVINKYNEQYGVKKIDGTLSFDEVFNQICLEIESVFPDFE